MKNIPRIRYRIPQSIAYLFIAPLIVGLGLLVLNYPIEAAAVGGVGVAVRIVTGFLA